MSVFVIRKYINALSSRLNNFKNLGNDTFRFSCPLCGDSKKNKFKARGHIYRKKDNLFFRCFNCNVSITFESFLKGFAPDLYNELRLENFISNKNDREENKEDIINEMIQQMKEDNKRLGNLSLSDVIIPVCDLPEDHLARKYVKSRRIPDTSWKYLSYAKDFHSLITRVNPNKAKELEEKGANVQEDRLVISTLDADGRVTGVIGRALDPNNEKRYIHIKVNDAVPKIFGLDRLDKSKGTYFVFEGAMDSLFFENSLATCDSNLSYALRFYDDVILVYDNQPRNRDIVRTIEKCIDLGFKVCLFPDTNPFKDVNEMILGGMLVEDIHKEIVDHSYEGMKARLAFSQWRKV